MKVLNLMEMEVVEGGGKLGCGFAVFGAAIAFGALITTPVGAVAAAGWAAAGYSIAIPSLATCFSDKF
jgi:hypothetical protein